MPGIRKTNVATNLRLLPQSATDNRPAHGKISAFPPTCRRIIHKQLNTSKYNNSAAAKYLRKRCFCCAILCRRIFFTLKGGSLKITAYKYSDSHVNIIIITLRLHAANVTVPRLHTESVRIPKSARRTVQRLSHRKVQRLSHRKCDNFKNKKECREANKPLPCVWGL